MAAVVMSALCLVALSQLLPADWKAWILHWSQEDFPDTAAAPESPPSPLPGPASPPHSLLDDMEPPLMC